MVMMMNENNKFVRQNCQPTLSSCDYKRPINIERPISILSLDESSSISR